MRCPFFEEVVVAFCRAYPVKKMVPSDRIQANCICTCDGFEDCAMFREIMARMGASCPTANGTDSKPQGGPAA
jgi:hypothetical protein